MGRGTKLVKFFPEYATGLNSKWFEMFPNIACSSISYDFWPTRMFSIIAENKFSLESRILTFCFFGGLFADTFRISVSVLTAVKSRSGFLRLPAKNRRS